MFQNLPLTFDDATTGPDAALWVDPIRDELRAFEKHQVWDVVPHTRDIKAIPVKWIFSQKNDGTLKARLVAVGCSDPEKDLYTPVEKASPTPPSNVILWALAHAVSEGWEMLQLDVKNVFLHSSIDRTKYVDLPPGSSNYSKSSVGKLNRAMYGLITAPMCWYNFSSEKFLKFGFRTSPRELCVFVKTNPQSVKLIQLIVAYVDDILLMGNDTNGIQETLQYLNTCMEIKNLGFPSRFVGLVIERLPDNSLKLTQEKYIRKIAETYRLDTAHPVSTPLVQTKDHLVKPGESDRTFPYREALGKLQYAGNYTHPDVAYALNFLARHQSAPEPFHWNMLKRVIRYLFSTATTGLHFTKHPDKPQFAVFTDSDYAGERKCRSTSAYLVYYRGNLIHGVLACRELLQEVHKKQNTVLSMMPHMSFYFSHGSQKNFLGQSRTQLLYVRTILPQLLIVNLDPTKVVLST